MRDLRSKINLENSWFDAFQVLFEQGFDSGVVNLSLAWGCYILGERMLQIGKPPWIIGQWEVIYSLATRETTREWYWENRKNIIVIWPPASGKYISMRSLLLEAQGITKRLGLQNPMLVAHREHLARCQALAEKIFGKKNIVTPYFHLPFEDEMAFDPGSKQPQTCNAKSWRAYEWKVRLHHTLMGWT
jgi:hypothetical protein